MFYWTLTKRKIDPSVIEYLSVASFQVLKAVDDVGVDGGLDLQPAVGSFLLKKLDGPHERGPTGFVRCPEKGIEKIKPT